mgnify:CR=1 FL=1
MKEMKNKYMTPLTKFLVVDKEQLLAGSGGKIPVGNIEANSEFQGAKKQESFWNDQDDAASSSLWDE